MWYATQCPELEQCSLASFKRAKCKGLTKTECKMAITKHLTQSGCHQLKNDVAEKLAEGADLVFWTDDAATGATESIRLTEADHPKEVKEELKEVKEEEMMWSRCSRSRSRSLKRQKDSVKSVLKQMDEVLDRQIALNTRWVERTSALKREIEEERKILVDLRNAVAASLDKDFQ